MGQVAHNQTVSKTQRGFQTLIRKQSIFLRSSEKLIKSKSFKENCKQGLTWAGIAS